MAEPKIMTQPLPQILDELEDYIKRVEAAAVLARLAADESREAAAQAKRSGEEAAEAAKKAADEAVAKVKEELDMKLKWLQERTSSLEEGFALLRKRVADEAIAVDKAFIAAKDKHIEASPFLEK